MVSKLEHMDIGPEAIGHALKDKSLYVPPNQRDYSWKDEHVNDLYDDLTAAIDTQAEEYFLGSIVVIRQPDDRLMVVDGQQRLATTLILFAAIRDFLDVFDPGTARKFERAYVLDDPYEATKGRAHLVLNEKDDAYFRDRILQPKSEKARQQQEAAKPRRQSHQRINKATKIAEEKVKGIVQPRATNPAKVEALTKWINFLEKKARVIWVTVPDESSAYVIFETMNDRGLELSATDLIKNYLFGHAGAIKIEHVKAQWYAMTGTLETIEEAEIVRTFVRQYWISQYGVVRSAEFFDALKAKKKSEDEVVSFSNELSAASQRYVALLSATNSLWDEYKPEAKRAIETLETLGVVQTRPLLLAALDKLSRDEMATLLTRMVSWAVRLLISGKQGSGALETLYGSTALEITKGTLKSAADITGKMLKEVPSDDQFRADFAVASVGKAHLARYYLRAMERAHKNDKEPYFVPNAELVITLEHILPDTFSPNEWPSVSKEQHDEFRSRIGNLVLLKAGFNSEIKNKDYSVKKPSLEKADLELTKLAGAYTEWGPEQIQDRQDKLKEIAVKAWPLK